MSEFDQSDERRIVVGVDGSQQSKLALRWAAYLAGTCGATIEAVMAWDYPVTYGFASSNVVNWDMQADYDKGLNATIDDAFGADRPFGLRMTVREGNAARVLLDAAEGATMLVVGSRGHGGFTGVLLGSVSSYCTDHATCPVVVIRGDQQPPATR
jgi:nucleotide-binding universal stress UspA family protein